MQPTAEVPMNQGLISTKLLAYLSLTRGDTEEGKAFVEKFGESSGLFCVGFSRLWGYCKCIQAQGKIGGDDIAWFLATINSIVHWNPQDGLASLKNPSEVERFLTFIYMFQKSYYGRIPEFKSPYMQDMEFSEIIGSQVIHSHPHREYAIGSLFTLKQLKELLANKEIFRKGVFITVGSYNHLTTIFNNEYFDSNSNKLALKFNTTDELAELIFLRAAEASFRLEGDAVPDIKITAEEIEKELMQKLTEPSKKVNDENMLVVRANNKPDSVFFVRIDGGKYYYTASRDTPFKEDSISNIAAEIHKKFYNADTGKYLAYTAEQPSAIYQPGRPSPLEFEMFSLPSNYTKFELIDDIKKRLNEVDGSAYSVGLDDMVVTIAHTKEGYLYCDQDGKKETFSDPERMAAKIFSDFNYHDDGLKKYPFAIYKKYLPLQDVLSKISNLDTKGGGDLFYANGYTPLYSAVVAGSSESVEYILKKIEAEPDNNSINAGCTMYDDSPLMYVIQSKHIYPGERNKIIDAILNSKKLNIDQAYGASFAKKTTLTVAIEAGDTNVIKKLLAHGANINSTNSTIGPLMLAVKNGDVKMAEFLLSCGAKPDMVDKNALTPLDFAFRYRNVDMLRILIPKTEYSDFSSMVPHIIGSWLEQKGQNKIMDILLANKKININQMYFSSDSPVAVQNTALTIAVEVGNIELVAKLLAYGADINPKAATESPLMLAVKNGDVKMVEYLLEKGASPDIANKSNQFPLDIAFANIHSESDVPMAKILAAKTDKGIVEKCTANCMAKLKQSKSIDASLSRSDNDEEPKGPGLGSK